MNDTAHRDLFRRVRANGNRLSKWRSFFASWQVGTRPDTDGETRAIKHHREATILLRAELNALVGMMLEKNNMTEMEWLTRLADEYEMLEKDYETAFPGYKATEDGMDIDIAKASETMKRLNFPA